MAVGHSPRRLGVAVGALLLVVLGGVVLWQWPAASVPVQVLTPRPLVHSVVATATVQTRHRANAGVQMAGKVIAVNVAEGDRVRAGQILLQLDDREARSATAAR